MMRNQRIRDSAKGAGPLRSFLFALAIATTGCGTAYPAGLVLVAADSSPTAYINDGKPAGILVDVVTEAFRRTGEPIEVQVMPWARCLAEVRSGRVDGIFSVFKLPERNEFLTYTNVPVITQVLAFFVPADSDVMFDGDIGKLGRLRIGTIRATSYGLKVDSALKTGVWSTTVETNNVDTLVGMLALKRIDLAIGYRHVVLDAARNKGYQDKIRELSPGIDEIPSYLAFNKQSDYSKVIADFDRALTSMKDDHSFEAIFEKYLGPKAGH
ncbi:transporter substrate-binding domain-containing protein [Bradyrhizobium sp. WYCCWR 13023]|uniref:Transporter substrate-binding domain-containing protein n=1 Tax=Bradyrhizobium zhengyangense TaxID=2911009 RepID=A0A9X1U4V6_9BRAD|nr:MULTISPECIES: transporter substrate-binding domain-containing protein [Bradyrhizobium]MCG2624990.1 transporter substrate-binding domain-containing protein [Bradyrhizobium zhengyangense]MCG2645129.1 transporter substrate-binding domain-containing protein [Bradyrhizobium zhengyangense]MDA9523650.1 ABC transporter substrate-binding protein [Bradyrhizobium sp. CCBAU 11434]